ncbi:hypothetical protein CH276_22525 [Rhodococcus sp. 06-470-2]|uniref:DUF7432 family protein n=1 Tax=unclassified Rhodococcus (in: high G+C Gram-positive bacteria) TaxID=192944 RepID=UPI000B9B3D9E|nr:MULTISPECIES: hypothetical protein [unclassified Rhodococcus (in: high G+C Gram-positive bacteria)]OZC59226.1 hypothetical protein CH276_22525 [Rhodococcus sp. 06-470-2]OZE66813.1 hypothetical protein CH265_07850 [Rhodococcus sp. 05-2221-1B]
MTQSSGRPTTFEDLDSYAKRGETVASFRIDMFADDPDLLRSYADFLQNAQNAGFDYVDGEIRTRVTEEVQAEKLAAAQTDWDSAEKQYLAWVETGVAPQYPQFVTGWAKREGLPVPEAVSA